MIKTLIAMALNAFGPSSALPRTKRRPTGAALRNPADPHQAARIEAAAAKRERKADVLHDWACRSQHFHYSRTLILK